MERGMEKTDEKEKTWINLEDPIDPNWVPPKIESFTISNSEPGDYGLDFENGVPILTYKGKPLAKDPATGGFIIGKIQKNKL